MISFKPGCRFSVFRRYLLMIVLCFSAGGVLILIAAKSASGFRDNQNDNLFALLVLRSDEIKGNLGGEIFPIALYSNGKYTDVSSESMDVDKRKQFERFKDYSVIVKGAKKADFAVEQIKNSSFMCSHLMVGTGRIRSGMSVIQLFQTIGKEKTSHSSGGDQKEKFEITLKWTPALSKYNKSTPVNFTDDMHARIRNDAIKMGVRLILPIKLHVK
jgi:hypothetical protein